MYPKTVSAACAGLLTTTILAAVPLGSTAEATSTTTTGAGTLARSAPAAPVAPLAPVRRIDWGPCQDPSLREAGAQCGTLVVPLDHADPEGRKIRLAVSRVLHTQKPYRGAVFTNPGGPGGPGLSLAALGQFVPDKVGLTYDWYGMDLRGVGESRPALSCNPRYFGWDRPPYVPRTSQIMRAWRTKAARYARACASSSARELLDHMRTEDNVADFESLRRAIGKRKVTFYGFSYGTYIAQVYATQHPRALKAIVMDGVVNPRWVWYRANLQQNIGFQRTIERFFAWVARYPEVYRLGTTQRAVTRNFHQLRQRLIRHPAGGRVGPSELDDALLLAGYANFLWPAVAQAWSDLAREGRWRGIAELYRALNPVGPRADNGYAVYLATICTDARWPEWDRMRRDAWRQHRRGNWFFTWGNTWFNAPCLNWPGESEPRVEVTGKRLRAPVLLLGETLDAATPHAGALTVRRLFPTSRLVAGIGGTSHAVSLFGIPCTDNAVAALLRNGSLPARKPGNQADKRCSPLPVPDPTASGRSVVPEHRPWLPVR